MTTNTSEIIGSLESYVLDIKPYHSKLSDIIAEYEFFDDVPVAISERHTISALLNSIWNKAYVSGPSGSISKYELRAPFSLPTSFVESTNFTGSEFNASAASLGYKLFAEKFRYETKLVKKNGIPQLEGHDYFQTKGAYSFDVLPNQYVVRSADNASVNWEDPDYVFDGDATQTVHPHNIMNVTRSAPTYSDHTFSIGALTVQTTSAFSVATNFEVRFDSSFEGINTYRLHFEGDPSPIVTFEAGDIVTCLNGLMTLSYEDTKAVDIPAETIVAKFTTTPHILTFGKIEVLMQLPSNFSGNLPTDKITVKRELNELVDKGTCKVRVKFDAGATQFRKWRFIRSNVLPFGEITDIPLFYVSVLDDDGVTWIETGKYFYENQNFDVNNPSFNSAHANDGSYFSTSVLSQIDLDKVDFAVYESALTLGQYVEVDAADVAENLPFYWYKNGNLVATTYADVSFDSITTIDGFNFTLRSTNLAETFSSTEFTFAYSDFIQRNIIVESSLFTIENIRNVTTMDEIEVTVRSLGTTPTFYVKSAGSLIGIASNYHTFVSDEVTFEIYVTPLFSSIVTQLNRNDVSVKIHPNEHIVTALDAIEETWTLVKVNPVGYTRPKMRLADVGELTVTDIAFGILTQDWTVENIGGTFYTVTGSVSGVMDTTYDSSSTDPVMMTLAGKPMFAMKITDNVYTPRNGDYYAFTITNDLSTIPNWSLVFGYDLLNWDDPYFDSRFVDYKLSDISFAPTSDIPSCIIELRAIDLNRFNVTLLNRNDYQNGTRTVLDTYPIALVDQDYTFEFGTLRIRAPYSPNDPQTFIADDLFLIEVDNPPPFISDTPYFNSVNMPFVHIYGQSYTDLPAKTWLMTATSQTEFDVVGGATAYQQMTSEIAYDNSEIHLTFYKSLNNVIAINPGDTITFDVLEEKPSYKVFGSISGEQRMATVGEWYNNGKIAFMLAAPSIDIGQKKIDSADTFKRRRFTPSTLPRLVKLDSEHVVRFNLPVRSDASYDMYTFKYVAANDAFSVWSKTGQKIGVDFAVDQYVWTDRLQNPVLTQDLTVDVERADGILPLQICKINPFNGTPIAFADGYQFNVEIIPHHFKLYHSFNGILFKNIAADDKIHVDDLGVDTVTLNIDTNSLNIPKLSGVALSSYLEAADNALNVLRHDDILNTDVIDEEIYLTWGSDARIRRGNKKNEIALMMNHRQNFADPGTVEVDIYAANKPSVKIGKIRQKDSNLRPIMTFEQSFIDTYFGEQGTLFNMGIDQGQLMNTRASTQITEQLKFADQISFGRNNTEMVNVRIGEHYSFDAMWLALRFEDSVGVRIRDESSGQLINIGGFDMLSWDDEQNNVNLIMGGPNDIDNDGIDNINDPTFNSALSSFDYARKYATQGLGIFGTERLSEPQNSPIRPKISEAFVIYQLNLPGFFDEILFDSVMFDSTASAEATAQLGQMIDVTGQILDGATYTVGSNIIPFTNAAWTPLLGQAVNIHGTITDVKVTRAIINHSLGTSFTRIIIVDDLLSLNEIPATINILNTNSFEVIPTVPRMFAVIVV